MFGLLSSILRRRSYAKCKSYITLTKTRLSNIKKRRNAVEKYLKNDIADLLRSGLDTNAYGKAERLLVEQKVTSCYNMIEQFCDCVSDHISLMRKQRECPEECREAMASLIYAAAWLADLPELRDLRSFFNSKYGSFIEPYANKEFVEKLRPQLPPREMKLQLINEIAQELSIDWDPKALEQKLLSRLPSSQQEQLNHQLSDDSDDEPFKSKRDEKSSMYAMPTSSEDEAATVSSRDSSCQDGHKSSSSIGSVSEDDADPKRSFKYGFIHPPYVKQNTKEKENVKEPNDRKEENDLISALPTSVRRRQSKLPPSQKGDEEERSVDDVSHKARQRSKPEPLAPATRAMSLPPDALPHRKLSENSRAASLQPDMLSRHVHPKLPDYDDLASRFAALKGK